MNKAFTGTIHNVSEQSRSSPFSSSIELNLGSIIDLSQNEAAVSVTYALVADIKSLTVNNKRFVCFFMKFRSFIRVKGLEINPPSI